MRIFDITGFDDPSTAGVNEGEAVVTNSTGTAIFHHVTPGEPIVSGSGLYDPFLRQDHNSGTSYGYNSDEDGNPANTNSANTSSLMLSDIPIVMRDGVAFYEFRLDVNEPNNSGSTDPDTDPGYLSIEQLKIFVSGRQANVTDYAGGFTSADFGLVYDLDATEDTRLRLDDSYSGGGRDDYILWIPISEFQDQMAPGQDAASTYVTFFSQFGPTPAEDSGFEEWRVQDTARVSGVKFNDVDGDGVRDAGEAGLGGFTMYVDANNNNQYDVGELSTVTKADGSFSFYGFPVRDDAYNIVIREAMTNEQLANYLLTTGDATGDHIVTISGEQTFNVAVGNMPIIKDFTLVKTVNTIVDGPDSSTGTQLDGKGDKVDFLISIVNTGNVALTNVSLSDLLEGATSLGYTLVSKGNGDIKLDVGEEWIFRTDYYTVTQDDLDYRGGGNNEINNVATATATYNGMIVGPRSDDAAVPLVYNPALTIEKTVTSISGGNNNGVADWDGDRINYQITVDNTGNISLTGVVLTDYNGDDVTLASGDADGDNVLDVDETWIYTAHHDVKQTELDEKGTDANGDFDGDGDTDNTATVYTDQTGTQNSTVQTPLVYAPGVSLEKYVSVDGGVTWVDADLTTGPIASVNAPVMFRITIVNTGNITLTNLALSDSLLNVTNGTPSSIDLSGYTLVESKVQDGQLDVGESATLVYSLPFAAGQHTNVATITTGEGVSDSDAANYWGMYTPGPGVRTPGFWSNLGFTFWDGILDNEPKQAGEPGFADGELLYAVDSDGDGDIDISDRQGLLIGDYDHDGLRDTNEDVIFISLIDAQQLINASQKTVSSDWVWKLGRDAVATWLNGLAGNNLGESSDPQSPTHYLDDAVDWFQRYAGTANGTGDELFDIFRFANPIKSGLTSAGDHNASQIHNVLDYYNNNGMTQTGGTVYAGDADSSAYITALSTLPLLMA